MREGPISSDRDGGRERKNEIQKTGISEIKQGRKNPADRRGAGTAGVGKPAAPFRRGTEALAKGA